MSARQRILVERDAMVESTDPATHDTVGAWQSYDTRLAAVERAPEEWELDRPPERFKLEFPDIEAPQ